MVAHQAPLSMEFSRQEYWSGLPCLLPGDGLDPGSNPESPTSPALAAGSLPVVPPGLWTVLEKTQLFPYYILENLVHS